MRVLTDNCIRIYTFNTKIDLLLRFGFVFKTNLDTNILIVFLLLAYNRLRTLMYTKPHTINLSNLVGISKKKKEDLQIFKWPIIIINPICVLAKLGTYALLYHFSNHYDNVCIWRLLGIYIY